LADALAGVVYSCETKILGEPVAPLLGIVESPLDDEIERRKREMEWLIDRRKEGFVPLVRISIPQRKSLELGR
jgi:hypothetical protein